MLVTIQPLVQILQDTHDEIVARRQTVASVLDKSASNSGSRAASEMYLRFRRFEGALHLINALGVEIKDPATGLCDFPARHQGRDVYLCWQLGEAQVEWWHEMHTGYAGRRHVNELL